MKKTNLVLGLLFLATIFLNASQMYVVGEVFSQTT